MSVRGGCAGPPAPVLRRDDCRRGGRDPSIPPNKRNIITIQCASLNSILLGYDIGVFGGALLFIRREYHVTTFQQELLVGSLNVLAIFGAIVAGNVSDRVGRRRTLALASGLFFTGERWRGRLPDDFASHGAFHEGGAPRVPRHPHRHGQLGHAHGLHVGPHAEDSAECS